jgi:predicted RNase H-like nuclease (RuvC/YqgF family)
MENTKLQDQISASKAHVKQQDYQISLMKENLLKLTQKCEDFQNINEGIIELEHIIEEKDAIILKLKHSLESMNHF